MFVFLEVDGAAVHRHGQALVPLLPVADLWPQVALQVEDVRLAGHELRGGGGEGRVRGRGRAGGRPSWEGGRGPWGLERGLIGG